MKIHTHISLPIFLFLLSCILFPIGISAQKEGLLSMKKLEKQITYNYRVRATGETASIWGEMYYEKKGKQIFIDCSIPHPEIYKIHFNALMVSDTFMLQTENFPNVQSFRFSAWNQSFMPKEIFDFKKLQILAVGFCGHDICESTSIVTLPDRLFELKHLKSLTFGGGSEIIYIPEKISQLTELRSFYVCGSVKEFELYPVSLAYLPYLVYFFNPKPAESYHGKPKVNSVAEHEFIRSTHFRFKNQIDTTYIPIASIDFSYNIKNINSRNVLRLYPNGQKSIEGQIDTLNRPIGDWNYYYDSGILKQERHYKNGQEIGTWNIYDSIGNILAVYDFIDERRSHFRWYYPNGQLKNDRFFLDNEFDGTWRSYDEQGRLLSEKSYKNNKPEGFAKTIKYDGGIYYKTLTIESFYKYGKKEGEEIVKLDGKVVGTNTYENGRKYVIQENKKYYVD